MALKTSLVIAGDASGAQAALNAVDQGLEANQAQAQATAKAYANADVAITKLANTQAIAKREIDATRAAFAAGEISIEQYNRELLQTKSALSLVEAEHRAAMTVLRQNSQALDANGASLGQQRAGYQNFGRQVQDMAVMLQGGMNIGTIISTQGAQVADAVAQMGGRFAGLASFLAGPWGAAVFLGASVLIDQLIPALFDSGDAADGTADSMKKVELASDGLSSAQSVLGDMFDLTTGKIKAQNEMLLLNARLTAINLRSEALAERTKSQRTMAFDDSKLGLSTSNAVLGALGVNVSGAFGRSGAVSSLIADLKAGRISRDVALQRSDKLDYSGLSITKQDLQQAILDEVSADLKSKTADLIDKSLKDEKLDPALRKTDTSKKRKKSGPNAATLAEMGEDTAKKIADIRDQFSDLPSEVERSNKAMRALDDIASDIERRRPPNYEKLKPALEEARKAVQDSLIQPFNEYLEKAREAEQIDRLLAAGREDEAEALKIVLSLQEHMQPLNDEQLETVLETVQAERQRAMVIRDQRALIQANINAVYDLRGALEQTVAGMFRGKFSLKGIITSIGNSYVQAASQRIVEAMFGDTLRALEDRASGQKYVENAGKAMAAEMTKGSSAVGDFATAVRQATARINGADTGSASGASSGGNGGAPAESTEGNEIVVTGRRPNDNFMVTVTNELLRTFGIKLPRQITDLFSNVLNKLEVSLPQVMQGALTGATASKMILGESGSSLGGAIGGAIGQKVGEKFLSKGLESIASGLGQFAGPIGSLAGGLIGGAIGGLFKKAKWGTSVVTGQGEDDISTKGNKASYRKNSEGAGGAVQDMVAQIAEQLGGDPTGDYKVSIGQYKGKWRVSTTGYSGKLNFSGASGVGLKDFGKEGGEEAALYATLDAIADGAIKGLSPAVEKALKSSSDLNKAVQEALKVQEVEMAIGGLGAELEKSFKDFERQAQERLRIAREYGFDVVAIEQRNAEDRLKLTKQLLDEQVGSLQNLIDEMTSGSLFEGSAVDQRTALLEQIAQVRDAAAKGEEGAADKLATLLEQLNSVSKDAYGTTGGFAGDRELILDAARDTITKANQRVAEAQAQAAKASDPALTETNAALDENNDQNAKIIAQLTESNKLLGQLLQSGKFDLSGLIAAASVTSR